MFRSLKISVTFLLVAASVTAAQAVPVVVASRAAQMSNDGLDWLSLGGSGTFIPGSFTAYSGRGLGVTVTSAINYVRVSQQGNGWGGNFAPGDSVLETTSSMTLEFAVPISGLGLNYQWGMVGAFTGQIEAFDALDNSLGIFGFGGVSSSAGDGSAPYIGIRDTEATISRVVITATTSPPSFAINQLALNVVPELDGSTAVTPLVWMALALLGLSRRRSR